MKLQFFYPFLFIFTSNDDLENQQQPTFAGKKTNSSIFESESTFVTWIQICHPWLNL